MEAEYKIIGGDGVEYGPASLDELQSWIREGRVAGMTPVWRNDLLKWSPADRYQELQPDLSHLYSQTTHVPAKAERPAGFWIRLGAHLIDRVLLIPVFLLLWFPIAKAQHWTVLPPNLPETEAAFAAFKADYYAWADRAALVFLPLFMVYDVALNGAFGATVGKFAIGARIRRLDGGKIGYARAMVRWWAERVNEVFLFAGYILIAFTPDKRGLHDYLAGTKVVYTR